MTDTKKPPVNLVIMEPASGQVLKPGAKEGEYDITVRLAQTHLNPPFGILARVTVNNIPVGTVEVKKPEEFTFTGKKITGDTAKIKVAKAGFPDDTGDSLEEIPLKKPGSGKKSDYELFSLVPGRVTSDGLNPILLVLRDKNGNPKADVIQVTADGPFELNGTAYEPTGVPCPIDNSGKFRCGVKVSKRTVLTFHYQEGGITKRALCLP